MSVSIRGYHHSSMAGLVRCLGFTCLLLIGVCLSAVAAESPLAITPIPEDAPEGFERLLAKQVDVFGIMVYATESTPDKKVLHAANVLAQYLDNDADGQPDNRAVIEAMRKHRAAVMMCATEREMQRIDIGRHVPDEVLDKMVLQGLFGEETRPGGASRGEFDATLEEVLHLITDAGYGEVYPEVFGREPGTAIAKAMDVARGGHFERVPRKYPAGAWYTYYDRTCRYRCQMSEYFYWGLTSILGAQDYPGRLDEIDDEWRLNTAAKVKAKDPTLYKLLTDPKYKLPTVLPDGNYRPRSPPVVRPQ
ncbi:MAG: hypothetical protein HQ567_03555 [Candidatus Nealsonbacteria bacterium]|nr:hypothetical protein [Candidatus Nealsonbacteria bacterium]